MPQIIGGVAICLVVLGYYGYLFANSNADTAVAPTTAAPAAITKIDKATIEDVRAKSLNGHIPITLQPSDLDNPQPFKAESNQ